MMKRIALVIGMLTLLAMGVGAALAQDGTGTSSSGGLTVGLWHLHAFIRWLIILVTVAVVLKLGVSLARGGAYDGLTRGLMLGFNNLMRVQWLLGLAFALALYVIPIGFGNTPIHVWEHLGIMTVAIAVAEMHMMWKRKPDAVRTRNTLIVVIVTLVLVVVGVALLPYGWRLFPTV